MDGESSSSRHNKLERILLDQSPEPHNLPLKDLKEITNDFSEEMLLGQGGFGKVYKGVLANGDLIAVKKLTWTKTGVQDKQYENEARHLMRLKHPNIVKLLGYCSETEKELVQYQGNYVFAEKPERLLCLEYLHEGSLRRHLSDESSGLDWDTRYNIIKGICYGLHYLHEEWQAGTPIIHRDLKPGNILLDDNMVPKISDFGLSKLFGEEQTRTITKNCDGTLGYMAPEYINCGIITTKLDIFSLGVIIIEIVTGHRKYPDEIKTSSQIEPVLEKWRNRLEKTPGYTNQEIDCEQIRRCILMGLLCMKQDKVVRPTTGQIIKVLHGQIPEELRESLTSFFSHVPRQEINVEGTGVRLRFLSGMNYRIYGRGDVLAGEGTSSQLLNGEHHLGSITRFREGSIRARQGKFIGASVCVNVDEVIGVRVQQAVMNPVVVQNRRYANVKSHPPKLDDPVYRLEEIARYGMYSKRLEMQNIYTVQDFLRALNRDPDKLTRVLQIKKKTKSWEKMVTHARLCDIGSHYELKSFRCLEPNVVLFFDCLHNLVGAVFGVYYTASNKFHSAQQAIVEKLKQSAYDQLDGIPPDHVMGDNFPVPIYILATVAGSVGATSAFEFLSHAEIKLPAGSNDNSDPDHYSTHDDPDQENQLYQEQFSPASLTCVDEELFGCYDLELHLNKRYVTNHGVSCDALDQHPIHVAPRLGQVETKRRLTWPEQIFADESNNQSVPQSAQGNMQNLTQDPLPPSNGASEASASAQGTLPPHQ